MDLKKNLNGSEKTLTGYWFPFSVSVRQHWENNPFNMWQVFIYLNTFMFITSPIIHVKRHPHAISMFSIQFKHLPNNWQYNVNPYVVFYSLSAVLYTIRSCCTGVLWLATWFSLNVPPATSTNWFQPQFDCRSLFYFVSPKKRKEDSNSSEGSSHTCEVMPSVKIFQVWARQLQNILITAIIDRADRLCELMNPKGALWCEQDCDIQICAWLSLNQIAPQKWLTLAPAGRHPSPFDIRLQTDGPITPDFWRSPNEDARGTNLSVVHKCINAQNNSGCVFTN